MTLLNFDAVARAWTFETTATLDGTFGPDRNRKLIVTLHRDGRMEIKPERRRQSESVHFVDVYRFAMRCRVGRTQLEKARERKAKKAERLARQRQERAERRLFEK